MFTFNFILTPLTNIIFGVNFQTTSKSGCCDQRFSLCFVVALIDMFDNTEEAKKKKTKHRYCLLLAALKKKLLCFLSSAILYHLKKLLLDHFKSSVKNYTLIEIFDINIRVFNFYLFFLLLYKNFNTSSIKVQKNKQAEKLAHFKYTHIIHIKYILKFIFFSSSQQSVLVKKAKKHRNAIFQLFFCSLLFMLFCIFNFI